MPCISCFVSFCFEVTGSCGGCLSTASTFSLTPVRSRICSYLCLDSLVLISFNEPTSEIFNSLRIYISTHEIFNISTLFYQTLPLALISRLDTFRVSHSGLELGLITHSCVLALSLHFQPNFPQVTANFYGTFPACCMTCL